VLLLTPCSLSWRRSLFESSRATDHKSIRPLDSADLGQAESKAVAWLEDVVDAETQRAQKIIAGDGLPRNATLGPNPLGEVEDKVRKVLSVISTAETQRVLYAKDNQDGEYGVFRPPSAMPAKIMGALGNAERMIKGVFSDIASAETTRANLGRAGEENSLVRPMDVPGALGDAKKFFADIQRAEWKRSAEKMEKQVDVVRPMDASVKGPLGAAEEKVVGALNDIKRKEEARLSYLVNSMPMESDSMSVAGIVEAVGVGVLRAPYAVGLTIRRVFELLKSEARTNEDEDEVEGEGGYDGEEV